MVSAEYAAVICEAWPGMLSDLTVALSQYDILLCSDMHYMSESLVPGFGCPVLWLGKMPRAQGMAAYVGDGY